MWIDFIEIAYYTVADGDGHTTRHAKQPGRCCRLLLIGYFEGLDAERAIAWRAADWLDLRDCLGLLLGRLA